MDKLRIALSHISVVVSVFAKPETVPSYSLSNSSDSSSEVSDLMGLGGEWFRRLVPITPSKVRLVGFGRAVLWIDCFNLRCHGQCYSYWFVQCYIYFGRMYSCNCVSVASRVLTSGGIYDIAALCSDEERLFFEACGFGDDNLGSTTMMYARTASSCEANLVKRVGRKLLLAPPAREPFKL
ncbi:GCN5-related N-acetyltransferase 3, chloroplastic-like [Actinidia eriantha]|uniref:GCN5-related N-acetyltransferase 3, chloroplastic-like n=1 Tax=Actinidia eriantha TaxID=165200 RepID=UPI00258D2C74|nr:GCN5-related N-acetyltransferase 3, chloroplastic-like [Actinidia eriantha]